MTIAPDNDCVDVEYHKITFDGEIKFILMVIEDDISGEKLATFVFDQDINEQEIHEPEIAPIPVELANDASKLSKLEQDLEALGYILILTKDQITRRC
ncbi:hypothetical protein KC723_02210 [Candidatus Kaiserbacteria bacterium]|nr:hypothetical protein [Candidatus Kaiserbacteria bacterium]